MENWRTGFFHTLFLSLFISLQRLGSTCITSLKCLVVTKDMWSHCLFDICCVSLSSAAAMRSITCIAIN